MHPTILLLESPLVTGVEKTYFAAHNFAVLGSTPALWDGSLVILIYPIFSEAP